VRSRISSWEGIRNQSFRAKSIIIMFIAACNEDANELKQRFEYEMQSNDCIRRTHAKTMQTACSRGSFVEIPNSRTTGE